MRWRSWYLTRSNCIILLRHDVKCSTTRKCGIVPKQVPGFPDPILHKAPTQPREHFMKGAHQSYRSFNIWVFWQHNDDAEAPLVRAHPLHLQIAVESAQFLVVLKAELTQKRNAEAVWAVSFQRQAAEKLTDGHTRYARKVACLGHRISHQLRVEGGWLTAAPPHRNPLPQARQEARAGLKRGVGSGNHRLMRADSPDDDPIDKAQNEN